MQDEDWLVEETGTPDSVWGSVVIKRSLNQDLVQRAQDGKLNERDLDIALSLTTFVHDEYQEFGTSSRNVLDDKDIAVAQRMTAHAAALHVHSVSAVQVFDDAAVGCGDDL